MPKLRLLQGTGRTSRAIKIAQLTNTSMDYDTYRKVAVLGALCFTNCACKRECTNMFAALDTSTMDACKKNCDQVKAKKIGFDPSKDVYWIAVREQLVKQGIADVTTGETYEPEKSGIENMFNDLLDLVTGGRVSTAADPTGIPIPPPAPKIMGMTPLVAGIAGLTIVGGIIYVTRKKPKRK